MTFSLLDGFMWPFFSGTVSSAGECSHEMNEGVLTLRAVRVPMGARGEHVGSTPASSASASARASAGEDTIPLSCIPGDVCSPPNYACFRQLAYAEVTDEIEHHMEKIYIHTTHRCTRPGHYCRLRRILETTEQNEHTLCDPFSGCR